MNVRKILDKKNGREYFKEILRMNASIEFDYSTLINRVFSKYKIIELIAKGGMSYVFLATRNDQEFSKNVAIKIVDPALVSDEVLGGFSSEKRLLGLFNHPSIVRIIDAGESEEGLPFIVMDLLEGTLLDKYISDNSLCERRKLKLFLEILCAVQYTHNHSIIHNDLKPNNIFVTKDGRVVLFDFGVSVTVNESKVTDCEFGNQEIKLVTPIYASPEQLLGTPLGKQSDIYQLGMLLLNMLAPVSYMNLLNSRRNERAYAPLDSDFLFRTIESSGLDRELKKVLTKAVKENPNERFQTVSQMAEIIEIYACRALAVEEN